MPKEYSSLQGYLSVTLVLSLPGWIGPVRVVQANSGLYDLTPPGIREHVTTCTSNLFIGRSNADTNAHMG
jgi:hypothetical protein